MNIRIVFRSSRSNIKEGYLSLRVYYRSQTQQIATGLKLQAREWDDENSQIVLIDLSSERRNYLRRINIELENKVCYLNKLLSENQDNSLEHIVKIYRQACAHNSFSSYVQLVAERLHNQKQFRTASAYQTTARRVLKFHCGVDFSLQEINCQFVENFERQLYEEGLSLNTISFYMRNLRAIYHRAIQDKLLLPNLENPFQRVFTGVKTTPKRALSKEDLQKVHSLDLSYVLKKNSTTKLQDLEQARDFFLFSFHARGMSFVDIAFLKKSDVKNGLITYCRRKTGQQLHIRLNPPLRQLINKYTKLSIGSSYLFPIIKDETRSTYNQYVKGLRKQNTNLKQLQKLAGVGKTISTHVSRHTWATIAKEENLPIWTISESLGHSSVKTTYIYLASINRNKLDEANDIVSKAVGFY